MTEANGGADTPSVPAGRRPPGYEDHVESPAEDGAWSPSAFGTTRLGHGFSPAGTRAASIERRFGRDARTPLPEVALVALAGVLVYGLARFMARTPAGQTGGPSSRLQSAIDGLILQGERAWTYRAGDRAWAVVLGLVLATIAVAALLRRLGLNAPVQDRFGVALALGALLTWWTLPVTLIDKVQTVDGALARQCLAFALLLVNILVLRAWLASKLWSAGHLPGSIVSIVTWVPMLVGVGWLLIVDIWGLFELQDQGRRGVKHRVTPTISDWALRLNRASWVSLVVLVLVVAVVQHLGISRDRRDQARAEEEDREAGIHGLGEVGSLGAMGQPSAN